MRVKNREVAIAVDGVHNTTRNAAVAKFLYEVFGDLFGAIALQDDSSRTPSRLGLFSKAASSADAGSSGAVARIPVLNPDAVTEQFFTYLQSLTNTTNKIETAAGDAAGAGEPSMPGLIESELCLQVIAFWRKKIREIPDKALDSGVFYSSLSGSKHKVIMPLKDVLAAIATLTLDQDGRYFDKTDEKNSRVIELFNAMCRVMLSNVCHTGQRDSILGVLDSVEFNLDNTKVSYRFPESVASYFSSLQAKYIEEFLALKKDTSFEDYMGFMLKWFSKGSFDEASDEQEGDSELAELKEYFHTDEQNKAIDRDLLAVGLCPHDRDMVEKKNQYFDKHLSYVEPTLGSNTYWHAVHEVLHMSANANAGRTERLDNLKTHIAECTTQEAIVELEPQLVNFIKIEAITRLLKQYKNVLINMMGHDAAELIEQVETLIARYYASDETSGALSSADASALTTLNKIINDFKKDPLTQDIENFFAILFSDQWQPQASKLNDDEYLAKFTIDDAWMNRYFPLTAIGSEIEFSLYTANQLIVYALTHTSDEWPVRAQAVLNQLVTYFETRLGMDEEDITEREHHRILKETSYPGYLLDSLKILVDRPTEGTEMERHAKIKHALEGCVTYNFSGPMIKLWELLPPSEQGKFLHGNEHETGDIYDQTAPQFTAARYGHIKVIKALLAMPAIEINVSYNFNVTALFIAAQHGHIEVVNALLAADGALVNKTKPNGCTPLYIAAQNGHIEAVKALLAAEGILVNKSYSNGSTPLFVAAYRGHFGVVRELLRKTGINVNATTSRGSTPLLVAAEYGHANVVRELLQRTDISVNATLSDGTTSLLLAAKNGHADVVRELLPKVETVNVALSNGTSPLLFAAEKGHTDVVIELLKHRDINVNITFNNGATALFLAAKHGHTDVVIELLKHSDRKVNTTISDGSTTALYIAVQKGHADIVGVLLATHDIEFDTSEFLAAASQSGNQALSELAQGMILAIPSLSKRMPR
ncbi:MAG: ankyrin repeat domain-containing protein [Coxiellaceae bacterium]|nr:ankyrin repeat domain-containing protein [Coxiellaceae bacterium]